MRAMGKLRKGGMVGFLVASLLFSSGCAALVLLGIGGTAGYLIKEGEEVDNSPKRKKGSQSQTMPSSEKKAEMKSGQPSEGKDGLEFTEFPGGIL